MNYDTYYHICRQSYKGPSSVTDPAEFYKDPVRIIPLDSFGPAYLETVNVLAEKVRTDFDSGECVKNDGIMAKHFNIWKFEEELTALSRFLVPHLEEHRYGCHLYVDKIYIYRTMPMEQRVSSYEWHYDNNPDEVVKTLIYLNDVDPSNSPYEYLATPQGTGVLGVCTRRGTLDWTPAPNNSRVGHLIPKLSERGFEPTKVLGPRGTTVSFVNNSIHRANPVLSGYRDVVNIRVKPTFEPSPTYVSPAWTTGFETSGVVNRDPEKAWATKD
tara:strand:+ start:926 stop:1738 length:813 start_codon:yes stop_codon:yes gene_type:complete